VDCPEGAIDLVARLAGLSTEFTPFEGERSVRLGVNHALGGNPGKLQRDVVEIRPDEAWRTEQSGAAQAVVTTLTLPLLLRYGYPLQPRRRPTSAQGAHSDNR
jgi:hypothetical protein